MAYLVNATGYEGNFANGRIPMKFLTQKQASNANPNILGHRDAMSDPDIEDFLDSMKDEMDKLWDSDVYKITHFSDIKGPVNILNAV